MSITTLTMTNKKFNETQMVIYYDNIYGDTTEDSYLFVTNMMDAINKVRKMVAFVSDTVIISVKTTHNDWEISMTKRKSKSADPSVSAFAYGARDMDNGREYYITSQSLGNESLWTIYEA